MSDEAMIDPALLPDVSDNTHSHFGPTQTLEDEREQAALRDMFSDDEGGESEEEQMGRSENQMSAITHQLRGAAVFGGRKAKRPNGRKLLAPDTMPTLEVSGLLGQANRYFAEGDLESALAVIKEVIRIEHNTYDAWTLLAEINKTRGNYQNQYTASSVAANLRPRQTNLWLDLVTLGKDLDLEYEEIDASYAKAIKASPKDLTILRERAQHSAETRHYKKAIDQYRQALSRIPHDLDLVQELAVLMHREERFDEAVEVLEAATQHYMQHEKRDLLNMSQLHMLSEAYVLASTKKPATMLQEWIVLLKRVARWIHGRQAQQFWDEREDDAEFDEDDERRLTEPMHNVAAELEDAKAYKLPVEIHVRMGQLRLATGEEGYDEGKRHFEALDLDRLDLYWDLVLEAAKSLQERDLNETAVEYFQILVDQDYADLATCFAYAKALKALGEYEQAQEMLEFIIDKDPEDTEAMETLALVHDLSGDRQAALDLINTVLEMRRAEDEHWAPDQRFGQTQDQHDRDVLMQGDSRSQKRQTGRPNAGKRKRTTGLGSRVNATRQEDQIAYETRKLKETAQCIMQLDATQEDMLAGDVEATDRWMKAASNLVADFQSVGHFFPSKKKKPDAILSQQIVRGRGRLKAIQTAEERLLGMANRLQEGILVSKGPANQIDQATHFRRVPFTRWLEIFMQYALLLVDNDASAEAWDLLAIADMASPFTGPSANALHTQLRKFKVFLACRQGDAERAASEARALILSSGLQLDPIRLYMAGCTIGKPGAEVFRDSSHQKFFLRFIKAMDRALGRPVESGYSKDLETAPKKDVAHLLTLYGEKLNAGRQHVLAIHYFMRAYHVAPDDPRVNLNLGIAYIQRAMQRQVENRNTAVVTAVAFLQKYYRLREAAGDASGIQEAEYNLARAYHGVSLYNLAIPRYRRVLEMSDDGFEGQEACDFASDAAYNLRLILVMSGHAKQAARLTERYLAI